MAKIRPANVHHPLHPEKEWMLRPQAEVLRENITPRMDMEIHNELHDKTPAVPMLGFHALLKTAHEFQPYHDTMRDLDQLLFIIDRAIHHPRSHQIETELGMLTMRAIELQKPYIRKGLIHEA